MTLQPLVENAIIHGVSSLKNKRIILLKIERVKNILILKVEDNGVGRKESALLRKNQKGGVHKSFVNQIMNGSAPANVFYNWIVNSEDVKVIFLSGTPIINKPAEIAILYNMLRGVLHVFEFSVISDKDEFEVQKDLRNIFYQEKSPIEQLHVSKKKGKIIISFTKTKTNFESILEEEVIKTVKFNDYSLESFFDFI